MIVRIGRRRPPPDNLRSIAEAAALMPEEHVGDVIEHLAVQVCRLAELIRREQLTEVETRQ